MILDRHEMLSTEHFDSRSGVLTDAGCTLVREAMEKRACQSCSSPNSLNWDPRLYSFHVRELGGGLIGSHIRVVCRNCASIQFLDAEMLGLVLSADFLR